MVFDKDAPKQYYLDQGYKEAKMGISPKRTQSIIHRIQGCCKQYGLKNIFSGTLHAAMGDTLSSMTTEISKII